jgi:hypothetical protein
MPSVFAEGVHIVQQTKYSLTFLAGEMFLRKLCMFDNHHWLQK